jgi:hypothetical protein
MIRWTTIILAIGLAIVGVTGIGTDAARWLSWLDVLTALFITGVASTATNPTDTRAALIAVAISTFALAVAGLAKHAEPWLVWCTFIAALGFLSIGIFAALTATAEAEGHARYRGSRHA